MNNVKLGQVRTWNTDTNNEHFIVFKDHGIHYEAQYWIIQYLTDGRRQTKTEGEILDFSTICDTNLRLYKYWLSCGQSDGGVAVNYVKVDDKWFPYSEATTTENGLSSWEEAQLIAVSDEELITKYSEYTLMEIDENRSIHG